jgi:ribosomal protein S18 acetylase RimI-like enzyme
VVGFGCWKHWERGEEGAEPDPVIQIQYFGFDRRFHGACLSDGTKCADRLYATLEDDALNHPDTTPEMTIDLLCVTDNTHGVAFWDRQGFKILGELERGQNKYYWMRRYTQQAG